MASALESGADSRSIPQPPSSFFNFGHGVVEPFGEFGTQRRIKVVAATTGTNQPAPEAIATDQRRHIQEVTPNLAARRSRGEKRYVVSQSAKVADVIGKAFDFERERAQPLGAQRNFDAGECFHYGRIGGGMSDGRVSRGCLHLRQRRPMRTAGQRFLHATMLVSERNFQMQNFFPRALESEMSRFDNAGMNGADGNFVDFDTFDLEEFDHSRAVAVVAAHWL
jgi:hypothetical protein